MQFQPHAIKFINKLGRPQKAFKLFVYQISAGWGVTNKVQISVASIRALADGVIDQPGYAKIRDLDALKSILKENI